VQVSYEPSLPPASSPDVITHNPIIEATLLNMPICFTPRKFVANFRRFPTIFAADDLRLFRHDSCQNQPDVARSQTPAASGGTPPEPNQIYLEEYLP
jgi:hypothetical protein